MLHAQALDVGQVAALRGLGILQQRASRGNRGVQAGAAKAIEIAGGELRGQLLQGGIMVKLPWSHRLGRAFRRVQRGMCPALGKQDFRRLDALQRRGKPLRCHFRNRELTADQIQPRQTNPPSPPCQGGDGQQQAVALVVQQRGIGERAGRDDARDLAFHRPFGSGRIAHLLADGDRLAEFHQLGQVLLGCMVGHARHLDRLASGGAARGERDAEQVRGALGIAEEQLVKIPHAVKQQHVRVLGLDAQVLLHHGGVFRNVLAWFHSLIFLMRFSIMPDFNRIPWREG
jgi:hypothetical protein